MNWKITNLQVYPQADGHSDVVVRVDYQVGVLKDVVELAPPSGNFVPFADLTEDKVLGWVWAAVDKAAVEGRAAREAIELERKLAILEKDGKKPSAVPMGTPWSHS
jgi:hypothetical protein